MVLSAISINLTIRWHYLSYPAAVHTVQSVSVANSGFPSVSEAATGCSSSLHCWSWRTWWQKMWVWWRLNLHHLIQQKEHQRTTLFIWMYKTRQSGSATKQIGYGFKALQVMCCLLTFILCYYHSLSRGEYDNALGFKALRRAQHLRVLTFLVLISWICVLRVTTEISRTTLETKTSLTGKSLKMLLPGMHITPGHWFWPPSHGMVLFRQYCFFHNFSIVCKEWGKNQLTSQWLFLLLLSYL